MLTRFHRLYFVLLIAFVLAAAVGCSSAAAGDQSDAHDHEHAAMSMPEISPVDLADGEKLSVVATTSIIGDVVANVGGDAIDLTVLMEIGQNPHSYEPAPQALAAVEDADIVFVNGLDLEEALMGSIENISTGPIVPVSAGIEPLAFGGHSDEHEEGEAHEEHEHAAGDPHVWIDPNNVMVWVDNIEQVLSEADPGNQGVYQANADAYMGELKAVDAYIREQVDTIPEENRKLVTDHELFGYFAEEYGFEVVGAVIPSFSTTAGASAGDVADLVELIKEENVPAIITGTTASQGLQDLAKAIAEEAGEDVKVLPVLTGSLAPAGEPGDTYIGYMRYNIDQIAAGLSE
jgi:ABC-type Zn uptake system ZnuABC Zn-binding protein ZnuA